MRLSRDLVDHVVTGLYRHFRAYAAAYLLIVLHFAGPLGKLAVVASCGWLFAHFVWKKPIDLFLVFLLLIPSIVFSSSDPGAAALTDAPSIFERMTSVVIIGPVALSTRLVFSMAIVARVVLRYRAVRLHVLTAAWLFCVALSGIGLAWAYLSGLENPAGLTVGFRIAMSVGAVLVPLCVRDREDYTAQLDRILWLTMPLLVLGLSSGHWMFIAFGLIPYTWMRFRPRILALVPLAYAVRVLASMSSSLTGLGIVLSSLTFLVLINTNRVTKSLLRWRPAMIAALAIPILVTLIVLRLPSESRFDLSTLRGYAEFKLIGDRKPVWDASYQQIVDAPALVVPAGSVMDVYFGFLGRSLEWTSGSHNIFLEVGRQIGATGMVLLTIIMMTMLVRTGRKMRTTEELVLFYCFLSIFVVFGITGNSLVYDGVGAMYWLLVGQLYETSRAQRAPQVA